MVRQSALAFRPQPAELSACTLLLLVVASVALGDPPLWRWLAVKTGWAEPYKGLADGIAAGIRSGDPALGRAFLGAMKALAHDPPRNDIGVVPIDSIRPAQALYRIALELGMKRSGEEGFLVQAIAVGAMSGEVVSARHLLRQALQRIRLRVAEAAVREQRRQRPAEGSSEAAVAELTREINLRLIPVLERHARSAHPVSSFVALHFAAEALALRSQENVPLDGVWFTAVWPVYRPVYGAESVTDLVPELQRLTLPAHQAESHQRIFGWYLKAYASVIRAKMDMAAASHFTGAEMAVAVPTQRMGYSFAEAARVAAAGGELTVTLPLVARPELIQIYDALGKWIRLYLQDAPRLSGHVSAAAGERLLKNVLTIYLHEADIIKTFPGQVQDAEHRLRELYRSTMQLFGEIRRPAEDKQLDIEKIRRRFAFPPPEASFPSV